jgi:hypothetical protein
MRVELVVPVLVIWLCWVIFILSTALIVFKKFSKKKILENALNNNIWFYILLCFVLPIIISNFFYEKGSKVPGALISYFDESIFGGMLFATFILYVILTILLIKGLLKKRFLGYTNKSSIIASYFILVISPIIYLVSFALLIQ